MSSKSDPAHKAETFYKRATGFDMHSGPGSFAHHSCYRYAASGLDGDQAHLMNIWPAKSAIIIAIQCFRDNYQADHRISSVLSDCQRQVAVSETSTQFYSAIDYAAQMTSGLTPKRLH